MKPLNLSISEALPMGPHPISISEAPPKVLRPVSMAEATPTTLKPLSISDALPPTASYHPSHLQLSQATTGIEAFHFIIFKISPLCF